METKTGNESMPYNTGDGWCETCGDWSSDLLEGMCRPCRVRYLVDDPEELGHGDR